MKKTVHILLLLACSAMPIKAADEAVSAVQEAVLQEYGQVIERVYGEYSNEELCGRCLYQTEGTDEFNDELDATFKEMQEELNIPFLAVAFVEGSNGKCMVLDQTESNDEHKKIQPYLVKKGLRHLILREHEGVKERVREASDRINAIFQKEEGAVAWREEDRRTKREEQAGFWWSAHGAHIVTEDDVTNRGGQ